MVWTGFFWVVDRLGPVFKGPVAVPEYLKRSRLVAVASCLILREKKLDLTGLENTKNKLSIFNQEACSTELLASLRQKRVQCPQDKNIPPCMSTSNSVMVGQVVCNMMYFLSIITDLPSRPPSYKLQLRISNSTPSRNS